MNDVLAVTQQQKIGIAVAVVMGVGWLVYVGYVVLGRQGPPPGSEIEYAPNRRPYLDDEAMEGRRLDRALGWALALIAITAIGLPVYWLREPSRQKGAGLDRGEKWFTDESLLRGKRLFQISPGDPPTPREPHFGCAQCHGADGSGGAAIFTLTDPTNPNAPPRQVQWKAPALNTVTLRFRDSEITNIITYGRAGTPMPAWGTAGGGPMDDQQIQDLVNYLHSIALPAKKVQADNLKTYGTDGAKLFDAFCARCHTQGWSYNEPGVTGGGAFGPNLTGGDTLRQFPSLELQIDWVTNTADYGKPYGVRGISHGIMPHFGSMLSADQIKAIVEYERTL